MSTSYQKNGVWYRPDGRAYENQALAANPECRQLVDDLIDARAVGEMVTSADPEAITLNRVGAREHAVIEFVG